MRVHAQLAVAGFYIRAGYRITGDPFTVAGIDHVEMRKELAVA